MTFCRKRSSCSNVQCKEEVEEVAFIRKMKRGSKKEYKKGNKEGSRMKDLSKVKCFGCHNMGHYVHHCSEKEGKAKKQIQDAWIVYTITGVNELLSQLETDLFIFQHRVKCWMVCG
jgi:hypothetical protein